MKFLLVPENNALSHIGKSLALEASLTAKGHQVVVAVSQGNAIHVQHLGPRGRILPDLQEVDHSAYPTMAWFRNPQHIQACIRAEQDLILELQPDRVLGIFRFTLKASAQLAGVPFDSLTCGCMLPETPDVLGFAEGDPGLEHQRDLFELYYRLEGARMSQALVGLGLGPIADIRTMLKGDRTFLWDVPTFSPLPNAPGVIHVGPIPWLGWSYDELDLAPILSNPRPLAILTFGTCVGTEEVALRMVRILEALGYQILLAAGGQQELIAHVTQQPNVVACGFAPLHKLLPHAALVACHGGQLTVFEALAHRLPILVMPFQAEQAHNGVCLERIGCGKRLIPTQPYLGNARVYVDAFNAMEDQELTAKICSLTNDPQTPHNLAVAQKTLAQYHGLDTLVARLVEA